MLIFIAALRKELSRLEPLLDVDRVTEARGCVLIQGSAGGLPVVLVHSGVGKARAQEACRAVIEGCNPEAVISIGFAGGVDPDVKGGDLIVGEKVYHLDPRALAGNGGAAKPRCLSPDTSLLEAATLVLRDEPIPAHSGDLITVPEVAGPIAKQWIWSRIPAKAVEMESYWIAEAMGEKGIPFLAVRAATDEQNDPLPQYHRFEDEMGNIHPVRAALYYLTHPRDLIATPRLASAAGKAAANMGAFAKLFFSKIVGSGAGS